jgi:hypothetical protein
MVWITDDEDPSRVQAWAFISELRNDLILMDGNQIDGYNNTAWISSITGIHIPDDGQSSSSELHGKCVQASLMR